MKSNIKSTLNLCVGHDHIEKQLTAQGITEFDSKRIGQFNNISEAINVLMMVGYASEPSVKNYRRRLAGEVNTHITGIVKTNKDKLLRRAK